MNCREALEHFGDHVDGDLSRWQRLRLRLHLWICAHCRRYLRAYRITVQAEKEAYRESEAVESAKISDDQVESILRAAKIPPPSNSCDGRQP